jgi:hypothetical protein
MPSPYPSAYPYAYPYARLAVDPTYTVIAYCLYALVSVLLTIWVARTLHRNGRIFLVDAFIGNEPLADSVNHLLVVGFYLINIGYVCLALKYGDKPTGLQTAIEFLSTKLGLVLLVLGTMHFFNLYVFSRMRRRAILRNAPPPVSPNEILAGGGATA